MNNCQQYDLDQTLIVKELHSEINSSCNMVLYVESLRIFTRFAPWLYDDPSENKITGVGSRSRRMNQSQR